MHISLLMPQRKRQKKVQEFQASLKVGDRVMTTGGIYGQVTRVNDATVQLQIADKVRIEPDLGDVPVNGSRTIYPTKSVF